MMLLRSRGGLFAVADVAAAAGRHSNLARHSLSYTKRSPFQLQLLLKSAVRSLSGRSDAIVESDNGTKTASRIPSSGDMLKIIRLARPEVGLLSGAMALMLVSSGVNLGLPYGFGKVIDYISTGKTDIPIEYVPAVVGGVILFGAASSFGKTLLMKLAGERIILRLRKRLFSSIIEKEVGFFDSTRTGELVNRLVTDVTVVGRAVTDNLANGLRTSTQAIVGVSLMVWISPTLSLIMLSIVPPVALTAVFYGRYVRNLSKQTQDALSETTKVSEERLSNIRTVRAFAQEASEEKRYGERVQEVYKLAMKEGIASGAFFGGIGMLANLSLVAMLWSGGSMVMNETITVGQLSSFMLYTIYIGGSVAGLSSFYTELMRGLGASTRIFQLMEKKSTIPLSGGLRPASVQGHITFENVKFRYPVRKDAVIFDGLNLQIKPGKVTAIVGESGSGKSSISALLLRFYDPDEGRVLLDGHEIKDLDPSWIRENVGVVSQEPVLFAGSIHENIAYSNPSVSREQVIAAAEQANASSFIEQFPQKYDTYVGERGISLSGGQKQRVAIARALLKNPRILVLDEATSALDSESEYYVQEALERVMKGRTVITIAHRLSSIQAADTILFLSQGKVAEEGSYQELINIPEGQFRRLVERQMKSV